MTNPKRPSAYRLLTQTTQWYPRPPAPPVQISDMSREWRHNAARMLERQAFQLGCFYSWGLVVMNAPNLNYDSDAVCDGFDATLDALDRQLKSDPVGWIRTTPLYQALTAGLPTNPHELRRPNGPDTATTAGPASTTAAHVSATPSDEEPPTDWARYGLLDDNQLRALASHGGDGDPPYEWTGDERNQFNSSERTYLARIVHRLAWRQLRLPQMLRCRRIWADERGWAPCTDLPDHSGPCKYIDAHGGFHQVPPDWAELPITADLTEELHAWDWNPEAGRSLDPLPTRRRATRI